MAETVGVEWMQVIIRDGKSIAAIPPDYRLLDYDPATRRYLHRPEFPLPLQQRPSESMKQRSGLRIRGLSAVLDSEAVSSPPSSSPIHSPPTPPFQVCHSAASGGSERPPCLPRR